MRTGVLVGVTLVFIMMMTACSSKPASFADQWNKAVAAKDGAAAWKLVPAETRTRLLAALDKGRERAAADQQFARLRTALLAPSDAALPSQALAEQTLGRQLVVGPTPAPQPATTFATMIHADGAAAGILWQPPLGGEPLPLPAASAKSTRQPIIVDPATLAPVATSQRTIMEKLGKRTRITLLLEDQSGKTIKRVNYMQDKPDEWMETDIAGHRIVVRTDGELSEVQTTADNTGIHIRDDRHIKRYQATGPGLEVEKVWLHTHYIKDGVPYAEEPDTADRNVIVVYTRKDPAGADLSKLPAEELRDLAFTIGKLVNGDVVAYDVEGRSDGEADYRKAVARIAELGKLPPWAAGALVAAMIALDGAVGHDGVTHVRFRVTPGAEPKLRALYTTAAGEKPVEVAFTTI